VWEISGVLSRHDDVSGSMLHRTAERIAVFLPSLHCGGAERVMLRLAEAFAVSGPSVDLVVAAAEGPYLSQISSHVRLVDLRAGRVLASLPGLVRYLRQHRPTALLSAMEHANLVALWARGLARVSTRIVVSIHITVSDARNDQPLRGRLATAYTGLFYKAAQGVVAVSEAVADDFANVTGFRRSCIRTIYNPVVTPELAVLAESPVNDPWFAGGEPPVVLGVGRLTPQKDFPTLLHAFARVRAQLPVRLLILGEGEKRPELEALIQKLGLARDVRLPGYVDNPFAYMGRCSVFVLSSAYEGLPTALIEAMACGAPVVSTACASGPAEILEDGRYGCIVPTGDPDAMALAILTTLQNRPDTLRARHRAEMFSVDASATQYLRLLLGDSASGKGAARHSADSAKQHSSARYDGALARCSYEKD
jgi:glycosyltransferase involved in cell wall biosynthesis